MGSFNSSWNFFQQETLERAFPRKRQRSFPPELIRYCATASPLTDHSRQSSTTSTSRLEWVTCGCGRREREGRGAVAAEPDWRRGGEGLGRARRLSHSDWATLRYPLGPQAEGLSAHHYVPDLKAGRKAGRKAYETAPWRVGRVGPKRSSPRGRHVGAIKVRASRRRSGGTLQTALQMWVQLTGCTL